MACVNPDGSPSPSGLILLRALDRPGSERDLAGRTGRPLFQVRSGLRELESAGLVRAARDGFELTEGGRERLAVA